MIKLENFLRFKLKKRIDRQNNEAEHDYLDMKYLSADRFPCVYVRSKDRYLCLIGRYDVTEFLSNGHIKVETGTHGSWVEILIQEKDIPAVKQMIYRDKGTLYLNVRPSGYGYILNERRKEHNNIKWVKIRITIN